MYKNFIKRLIDLLILFKAFIPLLVIGFVIGILIKMDSKGSLLFKQKRLGEGGKVFEIYKFRTMVQNAEKIGTGIYTSRSDPRITKVGKFLRRSSLDELPQLINILKGDMSLIGPRPPVPHHPYSYEKYTSEQKKRFQVKPGVTGLAQSTGRNQLTWDERIVYDVKYVENISFLLDIKIVLKTIISLLFFKGV